MFLNHILLGFLGIAFGGAVAAGTFAFVIVIGVVPRMIGKCNRAANTLCFEQAIILGGILGNIVSVFLQMHIPLGQVSGHIFLGLYGLSAGMFVGCIAVALAEILNTFPILFQQGKTESWSPVGHVDDGGRQDVRGALLFCEKNRGRVVVGEV